MLDERISQAREMLENPENYKWSLQGFGMLRAYMDTEKIWRLHVWDNAYAAPDVSTLHNHPWNFSSLILSGRLQNVRYNVVPGAEPTHMRQTIICGEGGCVISQPDPVHLQAQHFAEVYGENGRYMQWADEIHHSIPDPGTITMIKRDFDFSNTEKAQVFYEIGKEWVAATPRPATPEEVKAIIYSAMMKVSPGGLLG